MTNNIDAEPTAYAYRITAQTIRQAEGGWHPYAERYEREADRLEAVAARDTEAEELAEVFNKAYLATNSGDIEATISGVRAVLDSLAERGLLTPEDGTALTAEDADAVRWLLGLMSDISFVAEREQAEYARLRARFAPAEPAARCPVCLGKDGPCSHCDPTAPGPRTWPSLDQVDDDVAMVTSPGDSVGIRVVWIRSQDGWRVNGIGPVWHPRWHDGREVAPFVEVPGGAQ